MLANAPRGNWTSKRLSIAYGLWKNTVVTVQTIHHADWRRLAFRSMRFLEIGRLDEMAYAEIVCSTALVGDAIHRMVRRLT